MENDLGDQDLIILSVVLSFSLILNFCVFCFFHKEQSLYFSLLKIISLFEISFIFSRFLDISINSKSEIVKKIISYLEDNMRILNLLTFNQLKDFDFKQNNILLYMSMRNVYIILNILLSIETINLIKRPFSQSKNKANLYFIGSFLLILIIYILYKIIRIRDIFGIIYISLYGFFVFVGIISIILLVIRFCLHKPLIQSAKNFFVMRHIFYIIILSGMLISELDIISNNKKIRYIVTMSIGFVMSIIKISDQLFIRDKKTKKNSSKKGVTSTITSNLNVEFMCCILYGMTDIFVKNQIEEQNSISNKYSIKKQKKIHSIKYINTINSKMDDLKSLKLHVSIKHGKDSLLKEQNEDDIESNSTDKNNKNYINSNGEDASIIEYEPEIFNDLRKNDEISDEIMIKVFSPSKNKSAIDKMSESKGKSGSFFFYSHDRKFIIKTITEGEKNTLSNILHDYYNYIKDHKNTVITKIYGIYTIVIKNASSVNVILMQNLFGCSPIHIQRMFDLKGSEVQRKTKDVQKWKRDQVLKDLDYQWLTKIERKLINFSEEDISEINANLINDIKFFKIMRLMDYSLLFIIVDFPNKIDPDYNQIVGLLNDPKYRGHVYKSNNENYIYIILIIYYLQKYNMKKTIENFFKGLIYGKEKNMISAVEPDFYGDRFYNFMTKNVFVIGEE